MSFGVRGGVFLSALLAGSLFAPRSANARHSAAPQVGGPVDSGVTPPRPTIIFNFVRDVPGAPVPKYTLTMRDDGTGSYAGEAAPPRTRYGPPESSASIPFQRDLHLASAAAARLFDLAAQLDHFNRVCASKAKNIADTGTKTISYTGPDGLGSCTYNFTEVKELVTLTQLIQGITETLDEGRELDRLHRYDRLGLDSAMIFLQQEAVAGRALDFETIGDSLRAIAGDPDVLARVRARASALLAQAGPAGGEAVR